MAYAGKAEGEVGHEGNKPHRMDTLGPRTWRPWRWAWDLEGKGKGASTAQRALHRSSLGNAGCINPTRSPAKQSEAPFPGPKTSSCSSKGEDPWWPHRECDFKEAEGWLLMRHATLRVQKDRCELSHMKCTGPKSYHPDLPLQAMKEVLGEKGERP